MADDRTQNQIIDEIMAEMERQAKADPDHFSRVLESFMDRDEPARF